MPRTIKIVVAGLLLSLLLGDYGHAAPTILGFPDGQSCGAWTKVHREYPVNARLIEGWLLGYLSGWADTLSSAPPSAVVARDPLKGTDAAFVIHWMNDYCAQHPLDLLTNAAGRLMGEILSRQQAQ